MAPERARVMFPPEWLGQGMLNKLGKVRLGKDLSSSNYKYYHKVNVYSQGMLKLTCANNP